MTAEGHIRLPLVAKIRIGGYWVAAIAFAALAVFFFAAGIGMLGDDGFAAGSLALAVVAVLVTVLIAAIIKNVTSRERASARRVSR